MATMTRRKKITGTQLKDLEVDRVDGVDRPATGRSFLLFKSEGEYALIESARRAFTDARRIPDTDTERRARVDKGAVMKRERVSFGNVILGDRPARPIDRTPALGRASRTSFADVLLGDPSMVTKSARGHTHAVMVGGQMHSTWPSKRSALATAQDCLDEGHEDVSVKALHGDDESAQLRKSPTAHELDDDDDQMSDGEKRARGVMASEADLADEHADQDRSEAGRRYKPGVQLRGSAPMARKSVSFANIIAPDVQTFPIEDQPVRTGPREADDDVDSMGRDYDDSILARLSGGGTRQLEGSIPNAGAGDTYDGGIPNYRPQGFMSSGEGDRGRVGGEDRGVRPARPNLGSEDAGGYVDRENVTAPVRVGPNFVMNPNNAGLPPVGVFEEPVPVPATRVAKSRRPSFANLTHGPLAGTNFFGG